MFLEIGEYYLSRDGLIIGSIRHRISNEKGDAMTDSNEQPEAEHVWSSRTKRIRQLAKQFSDGQFVDAVIVTDFNGNPFLFTPEKPRKKPAGTPGCGWVYYPRHDCYATGCNNEVTLDRARPGTILSDVEWVYCPHCGDPIVEDENPGFGDEAFQSGKPWQYGPD